MKIVEKSKSLISSFISDVMNCDYGVARENLHDVYIFVLYKDDSEFKYSSIYDSNHYSPVVKKSGIFRRFKPVKICFCIANNHALVLNKTQYTEEEWISLFKQKFSIN